MFKKAFLIAGLITTFVVPMNAQGLKLGPQIGFQKATDADEGKLMFGAALRAKLSPRFGVEGSIGYRQENFGNDALTVRSWPVMVTALIYPVPIAYGAIGAGWYNTTFDYNENKYPALDIANETKQEFGWHFGGGVEVPAGPNFNITAGILYTFLNYEFKNLPGNSNLSSDFYAITAGLLFNL